MPLVNEERMRQMGLAGCELPEKPQCAPPAEPSPELLNDDEPKETDLNKVAELLRSFTLHWISFKGTTSKKIEVVGEDVEARQLFERFYEDWKGDTLMSSNLTAILTHPAYYKIIAMGKRALPFIFESLANGTGPWFVALEAIVIDNPPIYPEHAHDNRLVRKDWLEWACPGPRKCPSSLI